MSDVIDPNAPESAWPILGSRVLLQRYTEGNTLRRDHHDVDFDITGVVIETPASGSNYLSVRPDPEQSLPANSVIYDETDREAFSISSRLVTLRRTEFWQWTCQVTAPPAPPQQMPIGVGDRVSYVPTQIADSLIDQVWRDRADGTYTVVSMYDRGDRIEAHCIEVLSTRNRHNTSRPDWFTADTKSLRMVAKAAYTPIP